MTSAPLFRWGTFTAHSGQTLDWKIDCDALTDDDITTLALFIRGRVQSYGAVESIPRGGDRLADRLRAWVQPSRAVLLVDDVWTTGASMIEAKAGRHEVMGAVIFARSPVPKWVFAVFQVNERD